MTRIIGLRTCAFFIHEVVSADGAMTEIAAKVCFADDLLTEKNCLKLPKAV